MKATRREKDFPALWSLFLGCAAFWIAAGYGVWKLVQWLKALGY